MPDVKDGKIEYDVYYRPDASILDLTMWAAGHPFTSAQTQSYAQAVWPRIPTIKTHYDKMLAAIAAHEDLMLEEGL